MNSMLFRTRLACSLFLLSGLGLLAGGCEDSADSSTSTTKPSATASVTETAAEADITQETQMSQDVKIGMSKTPDATIVMLPKFRAVASGWQEMGVLFSGGFHMPTELQQKKIIFGCADFLLFDGKFNWIWAIQDHVTESDVAPYKIIEFEGGLYATATTIDDDMDSMNEVKARVNSWLKTSGFVVDVSRGYQCMSQMIYCHEDVEKGLGYNQLQWYIPIKLK